MNRPAHLASILSLLGRFPIVGIIGPRQIGKTTLARQVASAASGAVAMFDLEDPRDRSQLADPMLTLEPRVGLVILDEIQHAPELFPVLRVLADREARPSRFLVLGSASPDLLRTGSETLAGRIVWYELPGFGVGEVSGATPGRIWLRGGFPRSVLANTDAESFEWREALVRTSVERDLPRLGLDLPGLAATRFWGMLAHLHGQLWNSSELARSFGVSSHTTNRWLDVLCGAFLIRRMSPWFENLAKRQVKSPRIWVQDSGILHALLDIRTQEHLEGHPKVGASWEGFVIDCVARRLGARWPECHFWRTHAGAELDLLVIRGQRRLGFEIKRTTSPRVTPSMRNALSDLSLDSLAVVHAGTDSFPLADRITAVAFDDLHEQLEPL